MYIWNYYTQPLLPDPHPEDIWYEKDGKLYGRPNSYCRPCSRIRVRGKGPAEARRKACETRRAFRIDDPEQAYREWIEIERLRHHAELQEHLDRWNTTDNPVEL